jgi:hypothetical protein
VENRVLFRSEVSHTFHGRDIFAPVAAHLAAGLSLEFVGPETDEYVRGLIPHPEISGGKIRGQVIYRDRFGNLTTNIRQEHLAGMDFAAVKVQVGSTVLHGIRNTYCEVEKGQSLCLIGSSGYLEIAVREGDAGEVLEVGVGEAIICDFF